MEINRRTFCTKTAFWGLAAAAFTAFPKVFGSEISSEIVPKQEATGVTLADLFMQDVLVADISLPLYEATSKNKLTGKEEIIPFDILSSRKGNIFRHRHLNTQQDVLFPLFENTSKDTMNALVARLLESASSDNVIRQRTGESVSQCFKRGFRVLEGDLDLTVAHVVCHQNSCKVFFDQKWKLSPASVEIASKQRLSEYGIFGYLWTAYIYASMNVPENTFYILPPAEHAGVMPVRCKSPDNTIVEQFGLAAIHGQVAVVKLKGAV